MCGSCLKNVKPTNNTIVKISISFPRVKICFLLDQRYFLLFGSQQQTIGWIRDNLKSNNGAVFLKCEQFPKYLIGIQKVQMAFDHPLPVQEVRLSLFVW